MVAADTTTVASAVVTLVSVSLGRRRPTGASATTCKGLGDTGERVTVHGSYWGGFLTFGCCCLGSGCRCCLGL